MWKAKRRTVFYSITSFWVLFSFIKPDYLSRFPLIDTTFNVIRIICVLFLLFRCMILKKVSRLFILEGLFALVPWLVTAYSAGDVYLASVSAFIVVGTILWMDYIGHRAPAIMLQTLNLLMELLLYTNLLTIIFVPQGLYEYTTMSTWSSNAVWLFGLRNSHPVFLVLGCFCADLKYYYSRRRLRDMLRLAALHITALATSLLLDSGIGYFAFSLYLVLMLFCYMAKHTKLQFSTVVIIHIALFFALTAFSITLQFTGLLSLIGKSNTASGRTVIWATMWAHIMQKPFLGHGYMKTADLRWLTSIAAGAATGHNYMIDILFRGGVVTYIVFVAMLFELNRILEEGKLELHLYNLVSGAFFCLYLTMQSEGKTGIPVALFTMIALIAMIPNLDQAERKSVPKRRIVLRFRRHQYFFPREKYFLAVENEQPNN